MGELQTTRPSVGELQTKRPSVGTALFSQFWVLLVDTKHATSVCECEATGLLYGVATIIRLLKIIGLFCRI